MAGTGSDGVRSLVDWTVLGLLIEKPRHGFSVAKEVSAGSLLGQVWSIPAPMVYRALRVLQAKGMIEAEPSEVSGLGPRRTPMRPTDEGRRCFSEWLQVPVDHFRDARVLLRMKVHLALRLGVDPVPLLRAQRAIFERLGSAVGQAAPPGSEPEVGLLGLWRENTSSATRAFVVQALDLLES